MNTTKKLNDAPYSEASRLTRIETMLYMLCMHMGLDPRTGARLSGDLENNDGKPRS